MTKMTAPSNAVASMRVEGVDSISLILTGQCDSRCVSCSYWLTGKEFLSFDYVRSLVWSFRRYAVPVIKLTGGEPTLHPDLPAIATMLHLETDAQIVLKTHGGRFANNFDALRDVIDAYVVSLDAATREGYRRIRGVDWFNEVCQVPAIAKGYSTNIFTAYYAIVQKHNFRELPEIARLARRLGADKVSFTIVTDIEGPFKNEDTRLQKVRGDLLLDDAEIDELEAVLEELIAYSSEEPGFVLQSADTLREYPRGFLRLLHGADVPLPDRICGVPWRSPVVNEHGQLKPCFFLPEAFSLSRGGDPINHDDLARFRGTYAESPLIRDKICKQCCVYPYLLTEQEI